MSKLTREEHLEVLGQIDRMNKSQLDEAYTELISRDREVKKSRTRKLKQMLREGDVIILASNMKPRYLSEVEAPITEIKGTVAYIKLPVDPSLRKMSGRLCRVPLSAISKRVRKATS